MGCRPCQRSPLPSALCSHRQGAQCRAGAHGAAGVRRKRSSGRTCLVRVKGVGLGGKVRQRHVWHVVQRGVAAEAGICVYDRAGLGWSDPATGLPTATAHELHTLLGNAGIRSPFVLVGHSLGGLVARVFTHLYPTEVAAVGLVDSSHPDEPQRLPKVWLRDHRGGKLAEVALSYIRPLRAAPPDPHTPPHHDGQRADGTWRSHDAE